jgi:hypothetical protein
MDSLDLTLVRLRSDRYRADGIDPGATGVVVEDWGDGYYEVEFANPETGETIALLTLARGDVEPVEPASTVSPARVSG